jgi:hypothetical protein
MAYDINIWSKVAITAQSAIAAAQTITGITKANPGVATSVAHGYLDGDVVLLKVTGMTEANHMVVRVANKTTDTFELEGIDTTLFGTFASGGAYKATIDAAAATLVDVSSSGGENKPVDVTTIHDDTDRELPGNFTAIAYSMNSLWVPDDAMLVELKAATDVKSDRVLRLTFASGAKVYFNCFPSVTLAPGGSKGEAVTTPVSFKLRGRITAYAS